jgi:signal transduction histidine kinase
MISEMRPSGPPIARRDIAIFAIFAVLAVPFVGWMQDGSHGHTFAAADPAAGFLILLAVIPVLWRRRAPLLAVSGTLIGLGIHVAAFGTITRCGLILPLLFVEAFAVGAWLPRRESLVGLGLVLAAGVVCLSHDASAGWGGLEISVPVSLVVWWIGRFTRSRATMADRLRRRNVELRAAREANARLEVRTDRVRLSAELDQLLRSRLAELAEMAEAGGDGATVENLERIEAESRATLDQMRAVVGVLRDDGDDASVTPQPTLTHLDALLLQAKGADARLTVTGSPRALPAAVELSAYRVVEHLLGAIGDAPGVEVMVDFGSDALEVTVSGPTRRRAEVTIEQARERVALHRGTLQADTRGGTTRAVAAFPMLATV